MIYDMLGQNWSTLHSHSIDFKFRHSAIAARAKPNGANNSGSTGGSISPDFTACSPRSLPFSRGPSEFFQTHS